MASCLTAHQSVDTPPASHPEPHLGVVQRSEDPQDVAFGHHDHVLANPNDRPRVCDTPERGAQCGPIQSRRRPSNRTQKDGRRPRSTSGAGPSHVVTVRWWLGCIGTSWQSTRATTTRALKLRSPNSLAPSDHSTRTETRTRLDPNQRNGAAELWIAGTGRERRDLVAPPSPRGAILRRCDTARGVGVSPRPTSRKRVSCEGKDPGAAGGNAFGMVNILPSEEKPSHVRSQPNQWQSLLPRGEVEPSSRKFLQVDRMVGGCRLDERSDDGRHP